jgi:hypothetical protein
MRAGLHGLWRFAHHRDDDADAMVGHTFYWGLAFVVLVGCGVGLGQAAKEAVHYRIAGTVVNDRNGEPIPFCHMSAFPIVAARGFGQRTGDGGGPGPRQETTEADADAKGRFELEVSNEGRYRLSASARGFRVQTFEAHGTFSTAVVLTKAQPTHAVVFRASADATIFGVVTDEVGEGVRQAQVRLYAVGDPNRTAEERRLQMRNVAVTDDRGHYELPAMPAGAYKVSVSARPWYATPNPPAQTVNGAVVPSPDPTLDVVYPVTWYPGTDDESSGETIELKYGEKRQMDFRLNPVVAAHLRVSVSLPQPPAPGGSGIQSGPPIRMPQLERILADGTTDGVPTMVQAFWRDGYADIGGLAPGTYRLVQPSATQGGSPSVSIVHVAAGGTVSDAGVPEIPVAIRVDGDPTVTAGQVSLTDTSTGRAVGRGGMSGRVLPGTNGPQGGGRGRRGGDGGPDEATLHVPPGTYEVVVNGRDSFLTGVTATDAQVTGRVVKIVDGSPHLLVHVAAGLASIEGTASRLGKPSSGAMVLLVPATLGNPANLDFERRAQTATDGSFQFTNVIPGQYILVAIDHGWGVNWRDPATLRPYLLEGEPLDLAAAATAHPVVKAIAP